MTKNRENWLYSNASGLYFQHDGFVMRASDGKQYDIEEECELLNKYDIENRELKQKIKSITEILNEDIGYIDSFKKIEEVLND